MLSFSINRAALVLCLGMFAATAPAKDKHPKATAPARDEIKVVAHIPSNGEPVTAILTTQHYKREYLYAEQQSGKTVSLIDITDTAHPALLADMTDPTGGSDALYAVTGNAALVTAGNQRPSTPSPQTFRILSFADPTHPTVQQEFRGVTATARDDQRGLIFLANADGIWILQRQYAIDPEEAKLQREILRSIYETP
jgi:hypothetical protein